VTGAVVTEALVTTKESTLSSRRFVALVGMGIGPRIAFRSEIARVRICGLVGDGHVVVRVDDSNGGHRFDSDGTYSIPGGQSAQVVGVNDKPLVCEILTGGKRVAVHSD
jgi:hypothetical protein